MPVHVAVQIPSTVSLVLTTTSPIAPTLAGGVAADAAVAVPGQEPRRTPNVIRDRMRSRSAMVCNSTPLTWAAMTITSRYASTE